MSSPLVWIILPGLLAVIFFTFRRWERAIQVAGILTPALLAWLGWKAPIGERIALGPLNLELVDTLTVLGRRFTIGPADRPVLILIYLAVAFWFAGSVIARTGRLFIPFGLGFASLLVAALAVEPFLYAALLIEMAALVSVPLLASPGKTPGRGVMRFLVFQTLGMPFLLFTGWFLSGLETTPSDPVLIFRATVLISLGFIFLLGVFPFHTWIPLLAEESHPYTAAFIFFLLPMTILLFGLEFLDRFAWLRLSTDVLLLTRTVGGAMVLLGGIWAAFQRHLGRMMGFAVMVEIGFSLLAISAGLSSGEPFPLETFYALLLPRGLALGIWGLGLTVVQLKTGDLQYRSVQGIARILPIACMGVVLANFSMAGFPLLAGFPPHLALWNGLSSLNPYAALAALVGSAGLLFGGLRTLAVLVMGPSDQLWQRSETAGQALLLGLGAIAILAIGILPQWFLPFMDQLAGLAAHAVP